MRCLRFQATIEAPARTSSGSNQQELVIGKVVATGADILIFDEPTRGIHIGAKVEVNRFIQSLAEGGAHIVIISSELSELMNVTHRSIVMSGAGVRDESPLPASDERRTLDATFAARIRERGHGERQGARRNAAARFRRTLHPRRGLRRHVHERDHGEAIRGRFEIHDQSP